MKFTRDAMMKIIKQDIVPETWNSPQVDKGVNIMFSEDLMKKIIKQYSEMYNKNVTEEEAQEILRNLMGLGSTLLRIRESNCGELKNEKAD